MGEWLKNQLFVSHAIAATGSVTVATALTYPLDTLKVLTQVGSGSGTTLGLGARHGAYEILTAYYKLTDVLVGDIYFLLVRIKIKNMELEIRRRESTGSGPNTYVETQTLSEFELMEGGPVKSIPIRLFMSPYELPPTYRNINHKFSVKYRLNLVLVDEEDRRYFKQQEITVYRLLPTP